MDMGIQKQTIRKIRALPLSVVKVTEPVYQQAQDAEIRFIRKLDPDRVLAGFRKTAGLDTKGAEVYGGWEDSLIAGHCLGHYFTACAQAVHVSEEPEIRKNLESIVEGLRECQLALGTGFLSAATVMDASRVELQFDIEEGQAEGKTWVPWYAFHKVLQGMIDVYELTGNETAFSVAKDLGLWVYRRVTAWDGSVREKLLRTEYGGMNDSLYSLYRLTKDVRYKKAAEQFDDPDLYEAITSKHLPLYGIHANTTIPKFLGALNRVTAICEVEGDVSEMEQQYLQYAENFWEIVVKEQSYLTGGISDMEHFRSVEELDVSRTQCNCESCCAYNMLKLSRGLFGVTGKKQYADYYERTLRNAILGAINPENGTTTYFSPMGTGYYKYFGHPEPEKNLFWCCTGTGMEDFTKLGDSIYFMEEDAVYINQYIASEFIWKEKGISIHLESDVTKKEEAELLVEIVEPEGGEASVSKLFFRIPDWTEEFSMEVFPEGISGVTAVGETGGYYVLSGLQPGKIRCVIHYPMKLVAVSLPGEPQAIGFSYGPTVLAAKLSNRRMDEVVNAGIDVYAPAWKIIGRETARSEVSYAQSRRILMESEFFTLKNGRTKEELYHHPEEFLERLEGEELCFRLMGTDAEEKLGSTLDFVPYHQITKNRYGIYWYFL